MEDGYGNVAGFAGVNVLDFAGLAGVGAGNYLAFASVFEFFCGSFHVCIITKTMSLAKS